MTMAPSRTETSTGSSTWRPISARISFLIRRPWLFPHLAIGQPITGLDEPVSNGGFTVIDMGDNGKISDVLQVSHQAKKTELSKWKVPSTEYERK